MNPKFRNPLVLSIVATVFLIPVLILTMYIFDLVNWIMLIVTTVIYLVIIFLVFLYYGSFGKK
ncbi:MAG: hypothetical protein COT09_05045 [Candidatus Hydromicrobium americanum]|nr:MAG: hypothetical protein COT09_05045 [Candidatus Hydromicrobium americanum]